MSEGIQHLSHLVEKSYFIPAIQCIYYITPMFFENLGYLTSNATWVYVHLNLRYSWAGCI